MALSSLVLFTDTLKEHLQICCSFLFNNLFEPNKNTCFDQKPGKLMVIDGGAQ